jgi:hypothetical protein
MNSLHEAISSFFAPKDVATMAENNKEIIKADNVASTAAGFTPNTVVVAGPKRSLAQLHAAENASTEAKVSLFALICC